jgi:putative Holliday junction resolvase
MGRILGLDAGERRIGVAISDPNRSFALPLRSIQVDGSQFDGLLALVRDQEVTEVVVGLPLSLSGGASNQTERARAFASDVEAHLGVQVHLWDERLSSREAERSVHPLSLNDEAAGGRGKARRGGKRDTSPDTDAIAASIILQAYLDRLRFERS